MKLQHRMTHGAKERLLVQFTVWAEKRGLVRHRHDAQFQGLVGHVPIEVETGIRDTDAYSVNIVARVTTGLPLQILRPSSPPPEETSANDPRVAALSALLGDPVRSIHIGRAAVSMTLEPGSPPTEVEEALTALLDALHTPTGTAPYR